MFVATSLATDLLEAVFGPQTVTPAHGKMRGLDGQAFAAAQPSPLEDVATTGGGHASAKAVGFRTFTDFGLPGSFRHDDSSFCNE